MQPVEIAEVEVLRRAIDSLANRLAQCERHLSTAEAVNYILAEKLAEKGANSDNSAKNTGV